MYADNSAGRINLTALTKQEAGMIRDALLRALTLKHLLHDERTIIREMVSKIDTIVKLTPLGHD